MYVNSSMDKRICVVNIKTVYIQIQIYVEVVLAVKLNLRMHAIIV